MTTFEFQLSNFRENPTFRKNALELFFIFLFILLSLELVADSHTYIAPPTLGEAHQKVDQLSIISAIQHPGRSADLSLTPEKVNLIQYMTASDRFWVHRFSLFVLLICYLSCALGLWQKKANLRRLIVMSFLLKITHGLFYLYSLYLGRSITLSIVQPLTPLPWILSEHEFYYGTSILLSVVCILAYYWYQSKHLQPALS